MRILFLTTIYPKPDDTYMTGELAHELAARGHTVEVLHVDWRAVPGGATHERDDHGVRVLDIAPRAWQRLGTLAYRASKFVLTSAHVSRELERHFRLASFDAVVVWTPAMTVRGAFLRAVRAGIPARILFVFDFFPIHHREIGMIPAGPVFSLAKRGEEALMRRFTTIVCNLPGNIEYLRRRYRIGATQDVVSTPLWSRIDPPPPVDVASVRSQYGLPLDRPLAIFGGQIVEGRGIEQILEAAQAAAAAGSNLGFVFLGGGRLADVVRAEAERCDNVFYIPGVPRDAYLSIAAACDVGLVATVPGVSSFSFPTKTIDYLRAGLPVLAAVEPDSDYIDILRKYQVGEGIPFGDHEGMFRAAEALATREDHDFADRANRCLEEVFHVRHTADTVEDAARRAGIEG